MTVYVNGRFLTQPVSGVQRYAREVLDALDKELIQRPGLLEPVEVLVPCPVDVPNWSALGLRVVTGGRGHLWEQTSLARAARDGVLVSLGNSGPVMHPRQVLCLHDAHLFDIPQSFSRAYRAVHRALRPILAHRARRLITVSRHSAQRLAHHLRIDAERFHVIANSADHILRHPKVSGVPDRYGLTPGRYLLSVGNQSPNKNLAALVAAHTAAGPDTLPLALVGGAVPGVAQASAEHTVLGRVPDVDLRALYEGAAAFVFPSLHEGFGIPPLEAMHLGVPVICARAGAMPDVLGDAPLWFDPRDQADITRALREFAALDSAGRDRMRARGRIVAGRYSWQSSALALVDLIRKAGEETQAAPRAA